MECRADDVATGELLAAIEDAGSRRRVDAERAFLVELGGDCELPAGAHAVLAREQVHLTAVLASPDGKLLVRRTAVGTDGPAIGRSIARDLRAAIEG